MNEVRADAPCPCGSGKTFNKCCLLKETPALKNEFRDEVRDPYAGIPEDELVTRDQAVLLKELRFNKHVNAYNRGAVANIIESSIDLRMELLAMPKSPYREMVIEDLKKTIENNQNQLKAIEFPRFRIITLLALEELFAEPKVLDSELAKELAKPFGPMIRPVDKADIEDEEALTIDEEDNPAEVI